MTRTRPPPPAPRGTWQRPPRRRIRSCLKQTPDSRLVADVQSSSTTCLQETVLAAGQEPGAGPGAAAGLAASNAAVVTCRVLSESRRARPHRRHRPPAEQIPGRCPRASSRVARASAIRHNDLICPNAPGVWDMGGCVCPPDDCPRNPRTSTTHWLMGSGRYRS